MDEYKTMYLTLFNAIIDALAELENANNFIRGYFDKVIS